MAAARREPRKSNALEAKVKKISRSRKRRKALQQLSERASCELESLSGDLLDQELARLVDESSDEEVRRLAQRLLTDRRQEKRIADELVAESVSIAKKRESSATFHRRNKPARQRDIRPDLRPRSIDTLQRLVHRERDVTVRRLIVQTIWERELQEAQQVLDEFIAELKNMQLEDLRCRYRQMELQMKYGNADENVIDLVRLLLEQKEMEEANKDRTHEWRSLHRNKLLVELPGQIDAVKNTLVRQVEQNRRRERILDDMHKRLTTKSIDRLYKLLERAWNSAMQALIKNVICLKEGRPRPPYGMERVALSELWLKWLVKVEPRVGLLGLTQAQKQHRTELLLTPNDECDRE